MTTTDFIDKANLVHNNKYDYSKANYINARTKLDIICPKHGVFQQIPSKHIKGRGCKKCADDSKRNSLESFVNKAKIKHCNKYNYSESVYINNSTKLKIICPIHGTFEQTPNRHLLGQGCKKCGYEKTMLVHLSVKNKNSFLDVCPDKCDEWSNKNLNGPENYNFASNKKFWRRCRYCNYEWGTQLNNWYNNHGCPKCNISNGERIIKSYLDDNNIKYEIQYRISECKNKNPLPFDFAVWIDGHLKLIEYNGIQHYKLCGGIFSCSKKLKYIKKNDKIKLNFCKNQNIPLLVIPYTEFNNIESILEDFLSAIR